MPTHPAPTYQHHTVPIGGAPFVHPSLEVNTSGSSSWYATPQSTTPPSASSSSAWSQSSSPSSTSSQSSLPPSPRESALAYSKGLHQHTATMWESQRRQIERERLEQQGGSPTQSRSPRNSQSSSSTANSEAPRPTNESSRSGALDFLLGRSRSRKDPSKASRGHTRQSRSIA